MANPYYRITVKQTSRFGSSGRGGSTKNLLKNWLRTYVDQRAKQEKEAEHQALDPFWTRDGEGRLIVLNLPEFYGAGPVALTTTANNRDPFSRTDVVRETNSANLWAGGFFAGQYALAPRPEEQSYLSAAASDFEELAKGTNRQKEWIEKLVHQWDQLLASPLTAKKRTQGIRYTVSLDIQANQQLATSGIPASLALRTIWQNTLREYAKIEGFDQDQETLGWVAGLHQDKEHLHLHVALFPTTSHGRPLRLSDKQNSPYPAEQHLTRLVAIANIEAENFWRKELPDFHQTPAVQLARLQNQIDPPEGVNLEQLLPIYCANNKKLKLFPSELARAAFDRVKQEEENLRDLSERIRLLNDLPDHDPEAIFATAKRHAREKQQIRPGELQRLQELRKLCLRQLWEEQKETQATPAGPSTIHFAQLFRARWSKILRELQHLNRTPKQEKRTQPPETNWPSLQSLLSFGTRLNQQLFQAPATEETTAALKAPDYWFLWIKQRQQELYQLARSNQLEETERKAKYLQQLNETLQLLDQAVVQTATQALAPLKAAYPLLHLQLTTAVEEASPSLQQTVLRQRLIQEIQNAQHSPGEPTANSTPDAKTQRLTQLQGLRLLIQAAQLQKNEETRLRNTFRTKPGTSRPQPRNLAAGNGGCLSWIEQILDSVIKPASATALNHEINSLSPQEVLLQNPELLWELRQLARHRQSAESLAQSPDNQHDRVRSGSSPTRDSTSADELPPAASSQIRDLLKGFDLDL